MKIKKLLDSFVIGIGTLLGKCSRLIDNIVIIRCHMLLNSFHTARWKRRFLYFGESTIMRNVEIIHPENIIVGNHTMFNQHCIIEAWHFPNFKKKGKIKIGNNCIFGEYCHITSINRIEIGDNLLTGRFVLITDNSHGYMNNTDIDIPPSQRVVNSKGPVIIGNNVWIADKVSIVAGVTIGDNAIIASNAVVTHDIPAKAVAAGIPAKVVKILE